MQTIFEKTQYVLGSRVSEILNGFFLRLPVSQTAREIGIPR